MLCCIFFKAIHGEFFAARDMMLMSHLQVGLPLTHKAPLADCVYSQYSMGFWLVLTKRVRGVPGGGGRGNEGGGAGKGRGLGGWTLAWPA
jgi:hypothetical protein